MSRLEELTLTDDAGRDVALRDLWAERPAALVFLRHYGWLHCRAQAVQLHDHRDRFDARLWLVGMGTPAHARAFKDETGVSFPVLLSPDKAAYQAMDLRRGSTREVFSPRALAPTLGRLRHMPLRAPEQDWHQLGGTFVIAPGGKVVFTHRAGHPGDDPDIDAVVAALQ